MGHLDFDAAVAAEDREPVSFTIYAQTFSCVVVDDLPWTAGTTLADAPDEGNAAIEAIRGWFREVILPADWDRFEIVFARLSLPAMKRVLEGLVPLYSGRPTEEPSPSTTGSEVTGRTARVVRLWAPADQQPEQPAASAG